MLKLLLLLLLPLQLLAQATTDAVIKSNTNTLVRNANPVLRANHSLINDQIVDSKLSRVESYSASGTNTYTISIGWVNTYIQGLTLPNVFFANNNTGATTVNVNSLGAKAVQVKGVGLSGGEIIANTPYTLVYNGTAFQLGSSVGTVTNALTIGAELIAGGVTTYNGSVAKTLAIQPSAVTNSMIANPSITIAGNSTALGGTVTRDQITGIVSTGLVKQSAANTLIIATSGTDYAPATSGSSLLKANGAGGFANATSADVPGTVNAVTFNNSGSGAISGTTFNGGIARTISYNTIGASPALINGNGTTFNTNKINLGGIVSNSATNILATADFITNFGDLHIGGSSNGTTFDNEIAFTGGSPITVTDNSSQGGIVYAADYSSQFVNESAISKRYADNHLKGLTFSNSPSSGQVPQYNGTNITWTTPAGGGWSASGVTTITGNTSQTGAFTESLNFNATTVQQNTLSGVNLSQALRIETSGHSTLTGATANTVTLGVNLTNASMQFNSGAVSQLHTSAIAGANTYSFTGATTLAQVSTLIVTGLAKAGTNTTITENNVIYVPAGSATGTMTNTYGLTVNAQTGGSVGDYAAQFKGGFGVKLNHLIGNTSAPTIAAGTGAGTSPTVSITGTDLAGYITVTTGTAPTLSATIVTVTFNSAYGAAPNTVLIDPANSNAALLSGVTEPFADQADISTTVFKITSGTTALTGSTTYKWYYQVIQ